MSKNLLSYVPKSVALLALVGAFTIWDRESLSAATTSTLTWGGTSSTWETTGNWTPTPSGFPFTNADAVIFGSTGNASVVLGQTETVGLLTFASSTSTKAFTFTGSTLTIDTGTSGVNSTAISGGQSSSGAADIETFNNNVIVENTAAAVGKTITISEFGVGGTLTFGTGTLNLETNGASGNGNTFIVTAGSTGSTININGALTSDQASAITYNGTGTINFNPTTLTLTNGTIIDQSGNSSTASTLVGGMYIGTNGSSTVPTGTVAITLGTSGSSSPSALLLAGTGMNDSALVTAGGTPGELNIFGSNNTSATAIAPVTNTYSGTFTWPAGAVSGSTFEFYAGANNTFNISKAFSGAVINLTNSSGAEFNDQIVINGGGTVQFSAAGSDNVPIKIIGGTTLQIGTSTALGFGAQQGFNYNNATPTLIGTPTTTVGSGTAASGILDLNGQTINNVIVLSGGNLTNSSSTTTLLQNGIAGVNLTNTGTGFTSGTATVTFSGGGGSGAVATGKSSVGAAGPTGKNPTFAGVYGVTVTNAGSGYTSPSTINVTVTGPGGTGATGTAVVSSLGLAGTSNTIGGNAGNMTINAIVSDSGGAGGFSKVGSNTLTLAGANTFTGGAQVNAGNLSITGSVVSAVTVGGATASGPSILSGTGSISGAVIVASAGGGAAGTINAGVGGTPGTLTVGNITFQTGSTFLDNITGTSTTGLLSIGGAVVVQSGADFSVNGSLTSGQTYTVATDTGGWSGTNGGFTLVGSNLSGWQLAVSGDSIVLEQTGGTTPGTGTYTLATTVASNLLHTGATTTATTTLANIGGASTDTVNFTGLGSTAVTGSISGAGANGSAAPGATGTNTQTYTAGAAGTDSLTPTAAVTGANGASGTPVLASSAGANVTVYSGVGVWNTNGGGTWGTLSATPTNWTALGGTPGITPTFTTTDSANFGGALTSGSATVTLDGDSPFLNAISFTDSNAGTSYTIAEGSTASGAGVIHLDAVGTATITNSNGNNTIGAPMEFDTNVADTVASSDTLTLSGNISQSGGAQALTINGPGTTIVSGSNSYSGGTTVKSGSLLLASNGSASALGSGALTVGPGATFGGAGTVTGLTSVAFGNGTGVAQVLVGAGGSDTTSKLAIGASSMTINNANLAFNLSTTGGGNQLNVTLSPGNALAFTGNDTITLNMVGASIVGAYTPYELISDNTGFSGLGTTSETINGVTYNVVTSGLDIASSTFFGTEGANGQAQNGFYSGSFLYEVNPDQIDVMVVPEPGTWALLLGGLVMLVFWQRRRKNS